MQCVLVGNPNAGKTTLFNALTGEFQRVGNWSGVTVAQKKANFSIEHTLIELIDLPGMYALDVSNTERRDEQVAADSIASNQADCLINVIDATQLERHLYLTSQLLELKRPMVVVLTMMDQAAKRGIKIDTPMLSRALGCPVVAESQDAQCDALKQALQEPLQVPKAFGLRCTDDELTMMDERYTAIHALVERVEHRATEVREQFTAKLDRVLLHRFWAFPCFFAVMYALFFVVIGVGCFFQDHLSVLGDAVFVEGSARVLQYLGCPTGMAAWLTNGIGRGISTTLSFIPVMGLMFFLLACLEESGYMARVAFVMDRLMRFLGLPGKAFVPLIVGFGCNVPAVMAARTLDSERDRRLTILMSPFMSCSARLTIYTVFVAAFFPSGGHNIVFSLYLLGILIAILTGLVLRRTVFPGQASPLLLELPVYHWPVWRVLLRGTVRKLRAFLWRAGQFILPVCALLGLLQVVSVGPNHSLLSAFGQWIQPLFAPMGISPDNWPAVVGLITGMLAKEVVIGSLNSMYASMGSLTGLAQAFDGAVGAYAYLLFVLLYIPCASTVAVIRTEAGRRVMWFSVLWSSAIAYSTAVLFYQLGTVNQHPAQTLIWVCSIFLLLGLLITSMRSHHVSGGSRVVTTS
ncbi:MAG: ferrous iron transport protein B [Legionella sp.]|nr:ferrous iron transport protein B [Legionella sp.]